MLNSESRPVKPAAIAAIVAFWSMLSALNFTPGRPIRLPAKISCNIGEAMPMTPMPADTFMQRTHQINQNWWVLCMNVSAGIGVIGMASPMLQEIFAGNLIGLPGVKFNALSIDQKATIAAIAAGFTGLLSLFNIGGRVFWASLSDYIGRKNTYYCFFLLGIALYALAPTFATMGSKLLFVSAFCIILSMYGGGFATVPAYLADMFGTQFVGAIHGRLLTAWSTAGIVGPVVVNYIREFEIAAGVPGDHVYDLTMYVLAAMLAAGFICNFLIKPLAAGWFRKPEEVAAL